MSSFGIGGTNAHVIVEEPPAAAAPSASRATQLLVVSARSGSALEAATTRLAAYLEQEPDAALADVAYTLATGRRPFSHRRTVVCGTRAEAIAALTSAGT